MAIPAAPSQNRLALPDGTVVGSYRIQRMLGDGGFGITYLAEHTALARKVALKELLPPDFATRASDSTVVPRSDDTARDMDWARECFLNEARNLSRCEHRNVVKVYDVFEGNGTAYMAMGYEEGRTLTAWLKQLARDPTEQEVLGVLMPILDGLEKVHAIGLLHRDIKPDNLYICNDGRPVLLDFGAAREAVVTRTRPMTALVTAGYAPIEQYSSEDADDVGPASDLYALAATVYRMMVGDKPPEAPRRIRKDPYEPLTQKLAGRYSAPLLAACDHCLQVIDVDRPQSVAEVRGMIVAAKAAPVKESKAHRQEPPPLSEALKKARQQPGDAPPRSTRPPPLPPQTPEAAPVPPKPTGPGLIRRGARRSWAVVQWLDRLGPKLAVAAQVADGKRRTWVLWGVLMALFYLALFVGGVTLTDGVRPLSDGGFWSIAGGLALIPFLLARAPFRFLTSQPVGKPWMVFHALLLIPLWAYLLSFGIYALAALLGQSTYGWRTFMMIVCLGVTPVTRLVLLILGVRKHTPDEFSRRLSRGLVRGSLLIACVALGAWARGYWGNFGYSRMPLGLVGIALLPGMLGLQPKLLQWVLRLWYGVKGAPGEPAVLVADRGPMLRAALVMALSVGVLVGMAPLLSSLLSEVSPYLSWRLQCLTRPVFWLVVGAFAVFQLIMLILPMRLALAWRVSRRSIWWPIMVSGLLMGLLLVAGILCVAESMQWVDAAAWPLLLLPPFWIVWGFWFARVASKHGPRAFAASQNDWLLVGSLAELMVVGFAESGTRWSSDLSFAAGALGLATLILTFGVAIYLRWGAQRKHIEQPA